ncbi:MAG: hypothetical protein WD770_06835 [Actinomycetota bacterium]
MIGPFRARAGLLVLLASVAVACQAAPDPDPPSAAATSPPPPIPQFGPEAPTNAECFPESAGTRGVPGYVPVPATAVLQGPDQYAGPYEPVGTRPRRIAGRGFAYEVSSRVGLVAGFYGACLGTYATETEWTRLRAEDQHVLFRIPVRGRSPAVVLIAHDPEGGPTVVVIFTEYELTAAPSPIPAPSSATETPGPSPSA